MNKYFGKIGFAITEETKPGIWKEQITEREYYGDVLRDYANRTSGQGLNDDIMINNQISIISDPFAYNNYSSIKYVEWMGAKWKCRSVEVKYPRLLLSLGGVYND